MQITFYFAWFDHVYVYVCMYVCIYVYIFSSTTCTHLPPTRSNCRSPAVGPVSCHGYKKSVAWKMTNIFPLCVVHTLYVCNCYSPNYGLNKKLSTKDSRTINNCLSDQVQGVETPVTTVPCFVVIVYSPLHLVLAYL